MKSQNEYTNNWDSIAKSIADGEAVLVLGPDAIPYYKLGTMEEASFSSLSRSLINNSSEIKINYFYEKDNLFLFQDEMSKKAARKIVREIARDSKWVPDEELMRQIISMPFHIILSLSPDKILYDYFTKYYKEPQFDYCTPYNKTSIKNISEPTNENPLIFNLCGNVLEKIDSPILDYFDLFQLFIKLLSNSDEIPTWLGRKLKDADVYILVGFQLDRWYFQMFLHYLNWLDNNAFTNSNQNFPILSSVNEDSSEFILNQFNIRHIAPNRKDFDDLYNACKSLNILRTIEDNTASEGGFKIKGLIRQNKFEEVFNVLEKYLEGEDRDITLPLLRSRYHAWSSQKIIGITDNRDLDVELNKIRYQLLTFAHSIKQ